MSEAPPGGECPPEPAPTAEPVPTLREWLNRAAREYLVGVLEASGWNVTEVARLADVNRTHLYKIISQLGIELQRPLKQRVGAGRGFWPQRKVRSAPSDIAA